MANGPKCEIAILGESAAIAWLDSSVDEIARESLPFAPVRLIAGVSCAGFLGVNFGWPVALVWLAADLTAEALCWSAATRFAQPPEGGVWDRLNYLFAIGATTAVWSTSVWVYWFSNRPGFTTIAILVAAAQLIHAQSFAFRSTAAFAILAGLPAVMIAVLPVAYGGLRDGGQAAALFAVFMVLAYVALCARANLKSAEALRQARTELLRFTYLDPLTALTNRRGFVDELAKRIAGGHITLSNFAMVRIDLDRLKDINDTVGLDAGDALLIASAQRLRAVIGAEDSLSRIGGEEFALILGAVTSEAQAERVCEEILEAFAQPITVKGMTVEVTPSIGMAWFPDDGEEAGRLHRAADAALSEARRAGRNNGRAIASGT